MRAVNSTTYYKVRFGTRLAFALSDEVEIPFGVENMAYTLNLGLIPRTLDCAPAVELHQSFPSEIQAISPFVNHLMLFIAKSRKRDGTEIDIEIALREALANAIVHGNLENPRKRVHVTCRCTSSGEVSITVQDEGQGFESGTVPDPTAPENRLRPSGRGIYLMKTLMDNVLFEQGGTVVHMLKKFNTGSAAERKPEDAET
jgi:serine/threonine-protein kinase RsbW